MVIIDRFEGEWAVLEWEGRTFSFPRLLLPDDCREGDVLAFSCSVDHSDTEARREKIKKLERGLFRDS